jgi:hypothetical protein
MRQSTPWLQRIKVLRGPRIAGDDHAPAPALEAIAHGRLHGIVIHREGAHRHPAHLEDLALFDLGDGHPWPLALDHVMAANLDVPVEIVEELVHLPPGAGGPHTSKGAFCPTIQRVIRRWARSMM